MILRVYFLEDVALPLLKAGANRLKLKVESLLSHGVFPELAARVKWALVELNARVEVYDLGVSSRLSSFRIPICVIDKLLTLSPQ